MESPLISVIIPNYNHARFLDERIQSVLNQTYQNFEVIILDDKSTDNSLEVIDKYKDNPHVTQVVVNEENSSSPFKQWHKGFEIAKGELIWIAESDDSCDKELLEVLVSEILKSRSAVIAFCQSRRMDANGKVYNVLQPRSFPPFNKGLEFIKKFMLWRNVIVNASSAIFSKKAALDIDNFYLSFRGAGDTMFWIELAMKGDVCVVNKPYNNYRIYNQNTTYIQSRSGNQEIELKRIFDYCREYGLINRFSSIRLKKYHVYRIMSNERLDKTLKRKNIAVWKPNFLIYFLAYISKILH